jgi:hypothetical protein
MQLPIADMPQILERLESLAEELIDVWDDQSATEEHSLSPEDLCLAMRRLGVLLLQMDEADEGKEPLGAQELKALGTHGLHLISALASCARSYRMDQQAQEIQQQCVPFAVWLARHGGELTDLQPLVNALAEFANGLTRPDDLAQLHHQMGEIIDAASPRLSEDRPSEPWRLLLLNRAIVATRSHKPQLIHQSYDAVIEYLPDQAQHFLSEAMEQMDLFNYPGGVREIVEDYFQRFGRARILH